MHLAASQATRVFRLTLTSRHCFARHKSRRHGLNSPARHDNGGGLIQIELVIERKRSASANTHTKISIQTRRPLGAPLGGRLSDFAPSRARLLLLLPPTRGRLNLSGAHEHASSILGAKAKPASYFHPIDCALAGAPAGEAKLRPLLPVKRTR